MENTDKKNLRTILNTNDVLNIDIIPGFIIEDEETLKNHTKILKEFYQIYTRFESLVDKIEYPAYFNKGKNGPDLFSICLIPKRLNEAWEDYKYFEGVYIDLGYDKKKYVDIYIDGTCVYNELDVQKSKMPFILQYILGSLTDDEFKVFQIFINNS